MHNCFRAVLKRIDAGYVKSVLKSKLERLGCTTSADLESENFKSEVLKCTSETYDKGQYKKNPQETQRNIVNNLNDKERTVFAVKMKEVKDEYIAFCQSKRPLLHNIGLENVLTFEKAPALPQPKNTPQRVVRINIDGIDLYPQCVDFNVVVGGTVQPARARSADIYVNAPSADLTDAASVLLLEPFINKLKTGDQVSVSVNLSEKDFLATDNKPRTVSFSSRVFSMYEIDDYRNLFLKSRISAADINPYPLPPEEVDAFFGPLIRDNYFAVRVSVRNTDAEAKLISTGMIRAHGRALVIPKKEGQSSFTIPISVAPHSLEQIYAVLSDEEVMQKRPVTFRALEFVGALATAVNGLAGNAVRATANIGLFTGVFTPELRRMWPDRWPAYQKNLVSFAMPDLMKVPASSVVGHKYLFFSKREIEGLIADQNLYSLKTPLEVTGGRDAINKQFVAARPEIFLTSIGFDNLDIHYEKVVAAEKQGARETATALISSMPVLIAEFENAKDTWSSNTHAFYDLTDKNWNEIKTLLKTTVDSQGARTDTNPPVKADVKGNVLDQLTAMVDAFAPMSVVDRNAKNTQSAKNGKPAQTLPAPAIFDDLFADKDSRLAALKSQVAARDVMIKKMLANSEEQPNATDLAKINDVVKSATDALNAYKQTASFLQSTQLSAALKKLNAATASLNANPKPDAAKTAEATADLKAAYDDLLKQLTELRKFMPEKEVVMSKLKWTAVTTANTDK